MIRGKGELGTLRKIRIIAKLISILVIIKTKLQDNKGITSDYFTTTTFFCLERIGRINHGSGFIGVWRIGIHCGIGNEISWTITDSRYNYEIEFESINSERYSTIGKILWCGEREI